MHADDPAHRPEELIAIVGMAGRFPGAPDTDSLWDLLMGAREAIVPVPAERWDTAALLDPERDIQAVGGFLDDVARFDAGFFGVSPREAAAIDPQQRLMLELGWRALEDAGQRTDRLTGTRTGVYVGASWHDYELMRIRRGSRPTPHSLPGNALDVVAARLSYVLGLRGPSMAVETGCSSSLVALHLAAQALRQGEVDAAIVGGVNLMLDPHVTIGLTHFGALSPDGRSKAFSKHADGFVRGEGVAALYVKTLARALADGDRVHAVVARTVVNNDGGGDSLVTPSPEGQRDLLARAYRDAGAPVGMPAYIEAHGTGTGRGDPIEATAIGEVLGAVRDPDSPLYIGSIKTNIGHLEACAGMAGLFKLLLALRHRTIPPSLHAQELNPAIAFDELGLRVAREAVALPPDGPVHLGVNSFGWGGTNAHVVITSPPQAAAVPLPQTQVLTGTGLDRPGTGLPLLLPLSAKNRTALSLRAGDLAARLDAARAAEPAAEQVGELARTAGALAHRRDHFALRAAVLATEPAAAAEALRQLAEQPDGETPGVVTGRAAPCRRVAFVFPGQGSQWKDMGRALYRDRPLFADVIARCARALKPHCDWDLTAIFAGDAGDEWTTRIDMLQPTLWAMSMGLAELWRAAGVEPDVVLGHSQGEITAACFAGILTYEDAALVMARRSAIALRTSGKGRMLAVDLDRESALAALEGFEDTVSLAVHNGPTSCVLSGDEESVLVLKEILDADGTYCRLVNVDYASHSPQMDPLREDLLAALEPVRPRAGDIELMSTVRARALRGGEMDAAYWVENLRNPVRFAEALGSLLDDDVTHVVEISPHPVLAPAIEQIVADRPEPVAVLTTLRRDEGETGDLAAALARAYTRGLEPFAALPDDPTVSVPGYPLRGEDYWPDGRTGSAAGARGFDAPLDPVPGEDRTWRTAIELSLVDQPWLADHRVHGTAVLPGAATLSVVLDTVRRQTGSVPRRIEQVTFDRGMTLDDGVTALTARWRRDIAGGGAFTLLALPDGADVWEQVAAARVEIRPRPLAVPEVPVWTRTDDTIIEDTTAFYAAWAGRGLEYGPAFQVVSALRRPAPGTAGPAREVLGEVALPERLRSACRAGTLHPALFDGALQVALALFDDAGAGAALVPTAVRRIDVHGALDAAVTAVRSHAVRRAEDLADVTLYAAEDSAPLLTLHGVRLQPLATAGAGTSAEDERLHRLEWAELKSTDSAESTNGTNGATTTDKQSAETEADGARAAADGEQTRVWAVLGHPGGFAAVLGAAGQQVTDDDAAADAVLFAVPPAAAGLAAQRTALAELTALVPRLADRTVPPTLTVVTVGAQAAVPGDAPDPGGALFWGFGRVLCREHPELAARLVDIGAAGPEDVAACVPLLVREDDEDQTAVRGGRRFAARLTRGEAAAGHTPPAAYTVPQPFRLAVSAAGQPLALPLTRRSPGEGEVEIQVVASALTGSCTGHVVAVGAGVAEPAVGDRIAACGTGAPASHVTVPVVLTTPLPDSLDAAHAAPLPLTLATAGYALAHLGRLDASETVLVHVAGDPVTLVALRLARMLGARVMATAPDDALRARLRQEGVEEIFDVGDPAWPRLIAAATGGRGVDLMIGLPPETAPDAAGAALAEEGRLVALTPLPAGHSAMPHGTTVSTVNTAALLRLAPARFVRALRTGWDLVTRNAMTRLPVAERTFVDYVTELRQAAAVGDDEHSAGGASAADLGEASGGRAPAVTVLLEASTVGAVSPVPLTDGRLRGDGTYVITGGLGELGLSLAEFMAVHGAGRLALMGRSAPGAQAAGRIETIRACGVDVEVVACDVTDRDALVAALERLRTDPRPLRGVVHAAGVLADATIRTLTAERLAAVIAPKLDGAVHLDALTDADPLDFFVLFSSAAGLVGNAGQAAYAAANTAMDAVAQARRRRGRPALSVQWGPFTGVGLAARDERRGERLAERGMGGISAGEAWPALLRMLERGDTVIGYVPINLRQWFDAYPDTAALGSWQRLREAARAVFGRHSGGEFLAGLLRAAPEERPAMAMAKIRELAGRIMRLDPDRVEPDSPFKSLGLDSLMSLELRNRLEPAFGLKLSPTMLWTYGTPNALAGALCGLLSGADANPSAAVT